MPLPSEPPSQPHPTLLVITECQAGLPALFSSFPLAIYITHDSVFMSMLLSQFVLPSLLPVCPSPAVAGQTIPYVCVSISPL